MKKLIDKVEELKLLLKPKIIDWGRIWDALREIELCTTGRPNDKAFEKRFVKQNGTRKDFIKTREEQRYGF